MKPFLLFTLLLLPFGQAIAQQSDAVSLRERMGPEQFKAAGLDKLSADEKKAIDAISGENYARMFGRAWDKVDLRATALKAVAKSVVVCVGQVTATGTPASNFCGAGA